MPDESAFIRTILADPDADGPRLVYADWLEEQGDSGRAEFIRVQIELARLPRKDAQWEILNAREEELLNRYQPRWTRQVGSFVQTSVFRRGMMEFALVSGGAFIKRGMRLIERATVRELGLANVENRLSEIANSPVLRWLKSLELNSNSIRPLALRRFLALADLGRLESLNLSNNEFGDDGVAAVIDSRPAPRIRDLSLFGIVITEAGLELLASADLPALRALHLGANTLTFGGLQAFLAGPLARQLQHITLSHTGLTDAGAITLAASECLTHVTHLDLSLNGIGDAGVEAIASSPNLAALEWLDLSYNRAGAAGARALATSRYLADVRELRLCGARPNDRTIRLLQQRFGDRVHFSSKEQVPIVLWEPSKVRRARRRRAM